MDKKNGVLNTINDLNLKRNATTYRYNHKHRYAIEKHFISLIEKY